MKPLTKDPNDEQWEIIEIKDAPAEHGGGKGVFVKDTQCGLDLAAKFEYGGERLSTEECFRRMDDPTQCEYLLEVAEDDGSTTYIDAHPRLLAARGLNPQLWIGAFCNQANTPEERNAQITYVSLGEQRNRPQHPGLDTSISICIKVVKPIGRGQQILVNYGYCVKTQMTRRLGYTFFHRMVRNLTGIPEYDSNSSPDEKRENVTITETTWRHYRGEWGTRADPNSSSFVSTAGGIVQRNRKQTARLCPPATSNDAPRRDNEEGGEELQDSTAETTKGAHGTSSNEIAQKSGADDTDIV